MGFKNNPDINQFEEIVDLYKDRLFRFAYMRIGKREDAEDLLQDVFVALFRLMKGGREIRDLEHYLYYSVSNACVDYFRRNKRSMFPLVDVMEETDEEDQIIQEEFLRINSLLDELPSEQAETVRMKCYDNLTFRQIADLHDTVESTAKLRYRYAINHIKQRLNLRYGKR